MADEVTDDPLAMLAKSHLARMQEISDEGFASARDACADSTLRLRRNVGLRDAVLDFALKKLGIEEETKLP